MTNQYYLAIVGRHDNPLFEIELSATKGGDFCPKRPNGLSILEIVERYASKVEIDSNSSTMANTTKNLAIKVHAINISTVPQEFLTWADTEFDSKTKLRLPVEDILKEPMINRWVTISYLNLHKSIPTSRIGNITCGWALNGCGLSVSSNITHGTCICNHTGTIAALMLIVPAKIIKLQPFLVVACVLSVICIAATVLIHVTYWQLVKGTLSHINLQMFISIFVTDISLLSGLASTESEFFCGFTAILLHYTILAALMWMISRNLHILYMLAKGNRVKNNFKIYAILSIGIPFSISFLTAIITILGTSFDDYIDRDPTACWLSNDPPILLTCFVPLLVLGLGNCVLIACSYIKIKNRPITTKKDNDRYFNTGLFIAIIFGFRNVFLADYSNGRSKENLDIKLVKRQRKMKERALLNVQKSKSATASGKNHDKGENDITEV
ncbi:uncharacterized protein TRIADDRAFT_56231 [Trichoplax adhaerens]|uniref:G-protein coupled receptors family 2 profile 2 domain-containing protein n=1 Tax=Trichoplax adhaerens TaxID=10228 RepID=B3RXJ4_TRIAD|nr:hypothetical protein TRIADDRAFT_56231 [Trichoplax adhaerens]EDV24869.1 hypothetical protein TRIADDRAFT_56231 [Trichoplax adhaerens]|eukprot:XP_002112759.1 hypothetical protein TRIADDRAFT_56231 [Trichoplax adhaerens]